MMMPRLRHEPRSERERESGAHEQHTNTKRRCSRRLRPFPYSRTLFSCCSPPLALIPSLPPHRTKHTAHQHLHLHQLPQRHAPFTRLVSHMAANRMAARKRGPNNESVRLSTPEREHQENVLTSIVTPDKVSEYHETYKLYKKHDPALSFLQQPHTISLLIGCGVLLVYYAFREQAVSDLATNVKTYEQAARARARAATSSTPSSLSFSFVDRADRTVVSSSQRTHGVGRSVPIVLDAADAGRPLRAPAQGLLARHHGPRGHLPRAAGLPALPGIAQLGARSLTCSLTCSLASLVAFSINICLMIRAGLICFVRMIARSCAADGR